jgi:hypothetical protein
MGIMCKHASQIFRIGSPTLLLALYVVMLLDVSSCCNVLCCVLRRTSSRQARGVVWHLVQATRQRLLSDAMEMSQGQHYCLKMAQHPSTCVAGKDTTTVICFAILACDRTVDLI